MSDEAPKKRGKPYRRKFTGTFCKRSYSPRFEGERLPGELVVTSCGAKVRNNNTVPSHLVKGQWMYFCLPACKEDFLRAYQVEV